MNAHDRFILAVAVQMAAPVFTMVFLVTGANRWGVWTLAAAVVLGSLVECVVLGIAVQRLGVGLWPRWNGWTPEIGAVRDQYGPLLVGTVIVASCGLIDQAVAASLGPGSVSAFSYGLKVTVTLITVAGTGWATALLPEFSKFAAQGQWDALRKSVRLHMWLAFVLLTVVVAPLAWGSADLVRLMFQRGQFGPAEAAAVTGIQQISLMLVPIAVTLMIAQRLATAVGASNLVLRAGVAATAANIAGDFLLPRWFGVRGVAMAALVGHAVFLVALLALLSRWGRLLKTSSCGEQSAV
jgi:putative peptidoglycan lipid II flippase